MTAHGGRQSRRLRSVFCHQGFFVLRTPLLPAEEFSGWMPDGAREDASDAGLLGHTRGVLRDVVVRPEVREALYLASPSLDRGIPSWLDRPDSERGAKVEQSLVRYFSRMATRPTPFGLFSGSSVGTIGEPDCLRLQERRKYQRVTRLDNGVLESILRRLRASRAVRSDLRYYPNTTLHRVWDRARYTELERRDQDITFALSAVDWTPFLQTVTTTAGPGRKITEIAAALVEDHPDVEQEEAVEFVSELVDAQVLISELELPVTGGEPLPRLVNQLTGHASTAPAAAILGTVGERLQELERAAPGTPPSRYEEMGRPLHDLVELPPDRPWVQVNLTKPGNELRLSEETVSRILDGAELIRGISAGRNIELEEFARAFLERYGSQKVPLLQALDGEAGVGFQGSGIPMAEPTPLLDKLGVRPREPEPVASWSRRDRHLLALLGRAQARGDRQLHLSRTDIEALAGEPGTELPDSFTVTATIAAAGEEALRKGEYQIHLHGIDGPSGAIKIARFCRDGDQLTALLGEMVRAEEALQPEAIFAEIVHLPDGRLGNVLVRPVLRRYEIPILARGGASPDCQIPPDDLLLSIRGRTIHLRSARFGREVIPRLSSAHNYASAMNLGLYRFLATLQGQGVMLQRAWSWGSLGSAPFLPRVTHGRFVLALARWRLEEHQLQALAEERRGDRLVVARWREELGLPRFVGLEDGDNVLAVDLANPLSVRAFARGVARRREAQLVELWPDGDGLCVSGPEGHYRHEMVVPFVRRSARSPALEGGRAPARSMAGRSPDPPSGRSLCPGGPCLYLTVYCGRASADRLLLDSIQPVLAEATASGAVSSWFFVRYADPLPHLRVRFFGEPGRLTGECLPAAHRALEPAVRSGMVARFRVDTYEREVERYGGPDGIELAEAIFHLDSAAVLELLAWQRRSGRPLPRAVLAFANVHGLLSSFGFGIDEKIALTGKWREVLAEELVADATIARQLGVNFREVRHTILDPKDEQDAAMRPLLEILRRRDRAVAVIARDLRRAEEASLLTTPLPSICFSLCHMALNRFFVSSAREQELVVYDFLQRVYRGMRARRREDGAVPAGSDR